jgi:hypothetical protein
VADCCEHGNEPYVFIRYRGWRLRVVNLVRTSPTRYVISRVTVALCPGVKRLDMMGWAAISWCRV